MSRLLQHLLDTAGLYHLAVFHHHHLMRHGADHVHVVRNQQIAQPQLALQTLQQLQHLFLNGHIQRTGGLIEHQHLGPQNQGPCHRQTLALAA